MEVILMNVGNMCVWSAPALWRDMRWSAGLRRCTRPAVTHAVSGTPAGCCSETARSYYSPAGWALHHGPLTLCSAPPWKVNEQFYPSNRCHSLRQALELSPYILSVCLDGLKGIFRLLLLLTKTRSKNTNWNTLNVQKSNRI